MNQNEFYNILTNEKKFKKGSTAINRKIDGCRTILKHDNNEICVSFSSDKRSKYSITYLELWYTLQFIIKKGFYNGSVFNLLVEKKIIPRSPGHRCPVTIVSRILEICEVLVKGEKDKFVVNKRILGK
jgi:hypothetical protein